MNPVHIADDSQPATKKDLYDLRLATKKDLHDVRLATKKDLHDVRLATKKDLHDFRVEFDDFRVSSQQEMRQGFARVNDTLDILINLVANTDAYQKGRIQNHESRIRKLERSIRA